MVARRPPALAKVGVSRETHAKLTLAIAALGVTEFEFVERALQAELARARHQVKVNRYENAQRDADRKNRVVRPTPAEFGLPPDYGMPKP